MPKSISYSDFLMEGALREEKGNFTVPVEEEEKPFRIVPEDIATETETKAFWKRLRHYFRTGERPQTRNGVFVPALIAPYLRNVNWDTEYPYYLAGEKDTSQPLESLLKMTMDVLFAENEARVLRKNIPRLLSYFRSAIADGSVPVAEAKKEAISRLSALEVHDEEGERFRAELAKLNDALPDIGYLLAFHHEIPLILLRQKLEQIEWNRKEYKARIADKRDALLELLEIEKEKIGPPPTGSSFQFADAMIELDKVQEMMPGTGSSLMTEERATRIRDIIGTLEKVLEREEKHAHLIIEQGLKVTYNWEHIFTSSKITFSGKDKLFSQAHDLFDRNITAFTEALVAMRKAELELENKYDRHIHDDFFLHFKWFKLKPEELNILPPVVVFMNSTDLLDESMSAFSRLMVLNKPIKIMALTDRTVNPSNPDVDWEDASLGYRQELAATAMAHRNVHTLQCATDRPDGLLNGIRQSMQSISPSLMHILVPAVGDDPVISFLKINAAAAGRYFPYIQYDPDKGKEWGSRFDVSDNSQPDRDWPEYEFHYESPDGHDTMLMLPFTYADYKAITREKVEELFLVPEAMVTDYLVPVHEFMQMSQQEQTGKVPYIWLIDELNHMVRAALPYMWVASCQERLDFWNFIQELGGVNNFHARKFADDARKKWEEEKASEIKKIEEKHREELLKTQREAADVAMDKLTNILLNLDTVQVSNGSPVKPPAKADEPAIPAEDVAEDTPEDIQGGEKEKKEIPEQTGTTEAWVDSLSCTSCNDCTDKYPAIFSYNEEKQAYIEDASKGTFEQLVMAAESCPAACIHPGSPLNPDEPNLEELIERASKFN